MLSYSIYLVLPLRMMKMIGDVVLSRGKNIMKLFLFIFYSFFSTVSFAYTEELQEEAIQKEREKIRQEALKMPYPADFGKEVVSSEELTEYTTEQQEGYKIVVDVNKCSACHTSARILNSPLVELHDGKSKKNGYNESKDEMKQFQASHLDIFADDTIWKIDSTAWKRYVKRMIVKPGCTVSKEEAKKVYRFLKGYSIQEKVVKHEEWKIYRSTLVEDFKKKYPERYRELYADVDEHE